MAATSTPFDIFLTAVFLPILATLAMAVTRRLKFNSDFLTFVADLGWDLCVLGLGLVGGIVASPLVRQALGSVERMAATIGGLMLLDIILGAVVLELKTAAQTPPRRLACFLAGAFAVGLPSALLLLKV